MLLSSISDIKEEIIFFNWERLNRCSHFRVVHLDDHSFQKSPGSRGADTGRSRGWRYRWTSSAQRSESKTIHQLLEHGLRMGRSYALRPRLGGVDLAKQNNAFQPHRGYDSVAVGGLRGLRSFPRVMILFRCRPTLPVCSAGEESFGLSKYQANQLVHDGRWDVKFQSCFYDQSWGVVNSILKIKETQVYHINFDI